MEDRPALAGVQRTYTAEDVVRLRGSVGPGGAHAGPARCREAVELLHTEDYVHALGALTGNQAVQQVKAGLKAIYLSGWQVAADANLGRADLPRPEPLPGQLGAGRGAPHQQRAAARRPDHLGRGRRRRIDWLAPIVADAEAGFGGVLNAFELMKAMIEAGAAGVHWEDQLASEKKCGHLGGKVLVPTGQHVRTLNAARLAADVAGVPTLIVARTDAQAATCSPATSTSATGRSSPASAPPRASTGCATASTRASPAAWPTPRTPTCSGWRPSTPDLERRAAVRRGDQGASTRTRCSPTTARRRSTGRSTWTTPPSRSSSASSATWATSSSSSRWPASTP